MSKRHDNNKNTQYLEVRRHHHHKTKKQKLRKELNENAHTAIMVGGAITVTAAAASCIRALIKGE